MVAGMELRFIKGRQKAGIEAAKARGAYKGGRKSIDDDAIRALLAQGLRKAEVARHLGISRMTVNRALDAQPTPEPVADPEPIVDTTPLLAPLPSPEPTSSAEAVGALPALVAVEAIQDQPDPEAPIFTGDFEVVELGPFDRDGRTP